MMLSGKYGQEEVTAITKMERQSLEIRLREPDWMEHFSEFLDSPPSCNLSEILQARNDLPICRDAPTRREVVNTSGLDKISPEAFTVILLRPLTCYISYLPRYGKIMRAL